MEEGIDKWNAALGCNMHPNNTSTVYSTGNIIQMFGGERNAVDGVNQFDEDILYDYDNTPGGYVDPYSRYRDYENYTCSLGSVAGYYYVFANGFVLDKGTNNDYTNHYIKTCTHELGHALGWLGHSTNSNDIMYGESTTKTQLTSRDINHIKQMYDIWG